MFSISFGDTLSPRGIVPFYIRNPFKIHLEQKKSSPKNLTHLQFYIRNPFNFFLSPLGDSSILKSNRFKIHLEQFPPKIEIALNFT